MKLPKTLAKYEKFIDTYRKGNNEEVGFNYAEEEEEIYIVLELKFPYIFDDCPVMYFKTVKEALKDCRRIRKDIDGIHYEMSEVLEVLTAEEIEEVKNNMSEEELLKYFPVSETKRKAGRPKGTTQEITRNKRLEIKTTSDMNTEIRLLIKEYKTKYGIKNSDEVLLIALQEGLKKN